MLAGAGQISRKAAVKSLAEATGVADIEAELDEIDQDVA
jgi:hypothetical protein